MSKKVYYKCVETGEVGDATYFKMSSEVLRRAVRSGQGVKSKPHYHFIEDHREFAENHTNRGRVGTFKGKHHSEESKRKMSEANKGKSFKRRLAVIPEGYVALWDVPYYTNAAKYHVCEYEGIEIKSFKYKGQTINAIKERDVKKLANHKYNAKGGSKWERDVQNTFPQASRNRRDVIKPLELDLYFEDKKVAVECDGLYYHDERSKPAGYHKYKTDCCKEQGIRLIHIFEDEWRSKRDICISLINSAIGIYVKKYFARNLVKREVSVLEAKEFLEKNHIQGWTTSNNALGLYEGDELIQIVTFRKSPFKKGEVELARMCTKLNTQVVGGFSKLMKGLHNIISYVDLRLFNGSGYINSNWKVIGETNPGFDYTNGTERINRMRFMKHKIKDWEGNTEHEKCNNNGWYRVYNCGMMKLLLE